MHCAQIMTATALVWYRCAPYGYIYYLAGCGKGANKISNGVADARSYEKTGLIDPLSYMSYQKVYHWIPVKDELVVPGKLTVRVENLLSMPN